MVSRSRRSLLGALAVTTIGLAGCSSDESSGSQTPSKTRTPNSEPTASPTPSETPTKRSDATPPETPRDVTCENRWDPHVRWSLRTEIRAYEPTVADGVVYFGSQDGHLYAVNVETGEVRWRVEHRGTLGRAPVVEDDLVTYAGYDRLTTFDATTGEERWSFVPPGEHADLSWSFGVDESAVYVGASQHPSPEIEVEYQYDRVYALDHRTGDHRWRTALEPSTEDGWMVPRHVAATNERVFVSMEKGPIVALDAGDGTELWRRSINGSRIPVVAGDTVFLATGNRLLALDARTGRVRWRAGCKYSPAVSDGVGHCTLGGILSSFDLSDGHHHWKAEIPNDGCGWMPVVVGETVYLPTDCSDGHGRLYAFDASSGCRKGYFEVRSARPTPPAVIDETVLVGGMNGQGRMWAVSTPR